MGGVSYQTLADVEAGPDEAERLAAAIIRWLVSAEIVLPEVVESVGRKGRPHTGHVPGPRFADALVTPEYQPDVMSVVTTRTVFHPGTYLSDHITCPSCGLRLGQDDMSDIVNQWYDGGDGIRGCARCGRSNGINEWVWDPPWAFGHLGFEFVCWPTLRPDFVAEMADRLGHRVVLVDSYW